MKNIKFFLKMESKRNTNKKRKWTSPKVEIFRTVDVEGTGKTNTHPTETGIIIRTGPS